MLCRWFNRTARVKEQIWLRPLLLEKNECSSLDGGTHPMDLCRGKPVGKVGFKEAPPWMGGTVLPRNIALLP